MKMKLLLNMQKHTVWIVAILFFINANHATAQEVPYDVHDPVMIKQGRTKYFKYATWIIYTFPKRN